MLYYISCFSPYRKLYMSNEMWSQDWKCICDEKYLIGYRIWYSQHQLSYPLWKKKGYTELTMFINCPNWNAGKCIRQGNQFSINILQFYSYYVYHPLFPVTLIVYSYYLWHIQNRFKLNWIQFKCWNFKLFRHLSIIIYLIINCFGRNTLKNSLLSFFFPLKRTKFTYFSNACF